MSNNYDEKIAMFRFGVIAPLVCRRFESDAEKNQVRKEILSKQWEHPDGGVRKISPRSLRRWIRRYKLFDLDGLYDGKRQNRPSKGIGRAIASEVIDEAERLRREQTSRSVRQIIELLHLDDSLSQHHDLSEISERTLARHLKQRGARRRTSDEGEQTGFFQRWEQKYANNLWQGDTAHGIWLPDPKNPNKAKKTKLIAFIDDATRVITHAQFYWNEQLPNLVDCFSKALLKHGKPCRLLLDNAFIYHSTTLASMCAELVVELSFCAPRRPQGKGKIERWIRHCKESFYAEVYGVGLTSIDELNQKFQVWLERQYHLRVHSELEMTPLERWKQDVGLIVPVSPEQVHRALMLRGVRKVHPKTCTVALDGEAYQVSSELHEELIEVRWHPDNIEAVEIWLDGRFVEIAPRVVRRPHIDKEKKATFEEPVHMPLDSSKKYFKTLSEKSELVSNQVPPSEELLSEREFNDIIASLLQRELVPTEQAKLAKFFRQFAPVRRAIAEKALRQAVDVKGSKLHLRYYLQHLERVIQSERR